MDIINSLNWRYATKVFDSEKTVSKENLDIITESLRLTASSFGLQPWKFLIISNQKIKNSLIEHSWGQKQVVDCSHHIVFCRPIKFDNSNIDAFIKDTAKTRNQTVEELSDYEKVIKGSLSTFSENQITAWMNNQVYISLGNLLTTCALLKVDACPMEGIVKAEYDRVLGLKEKNLTAVVACPIDYRKSEDKYASLPKVRFPTNEVVNYLI